MPREHGDQCLPRPARISCSEALAIVSVYFDVAREEFLRFEREHHGGDLLGRVVLECSITRHDKPRHFAATSLDGRRIVVAPQIVELEPERVAAIVAHEFGHALDFCYPGSYSLVEQSVERLPDVPDVSDLRIDQARVARMARWQSRSRDDVEFTADALAETVMGIPIRYSGPCVLQGFHGSVRPPGLR